jgi:5-methylthioadenosine/S-adenosylhomocysteine deaminase
MSNPPPNFVICARWVVPVVPSGSVLPNHTIVIRQGRIEAILPTDALADAQLSLPRIDLPTHLVTAGFVNTHGHAAMTLLRGFADDLELMDWLNNHIWPVEGQWVDESFVYDGTSLAIAEMLGSGTTCAADTYFFPNAVARAMRDQGFRGQVCMPVIQFPNRWAESEHQHVEKALQFHDSVRDEPRITTAFAPHAPYTVSDEGFEAVVAHANALGIPVHLHLNETHSEVDAALKDTGQSPLARLQALGLLTTHLQAVHMTALSEPEIQLIAAHNVHIAHCPESNMKLASGICPVQTLLDHGVNVALGTDSAASNNNLDMLGEARSAAFLSKVSTLDATSISAADALSMATINGARLLGLEEDIGSLEPGKSADIIAVDFGNINFAPMHNPLSQLIYVASGQNVSHTWIAGECLYQGGVYNRLDIDDLEERVSSWQQKIQGDA